ncbi:MAG: cell division protein FtsL [Gammaproteobacteria bacterium]|nr:cell division protein FtsL [Gammaproteobacteria bacterium]
MNMGRLLVIAIAAAWVAVLLAALATVNARHEARKLFVELQLSQQERDELDIEWGQLRLEQSAYATHGLIEKLAREKMGMSVPQPTDINILQRQ